MTESQAHTTDRGRLTDPRTTLLVLALALAGAVAADSVAVAGLAIGGLAGFSLSGSP